MAATHSSRRSRDLRGRGRGCPRTQERFAFEYRLRRNDGEYRWIQDGTVPIAMSRNGHRLSELVSRYHRTRLASQSQAYLAAIVESADDAIIAKNLDGIIQSCNATAERMFGYTAAELIGQPVRDSDSAPIGRPKRTTSSARLRRGDKIAHFETVRLTKTGQVLTCRWPCRQCATRQAESSAPPRS